MLLFRFRREGAAAAAVSVAAMRADERLLPSVGASDMPSLCYCTACDETACVQRVRGMKRHDEPKPRQAGNRPGGVKVPTGVTDLRRGQKGRKTEANINREMA